MDVTLRIKAQYFENFSSSDTPHFKPKGAQYFESTVSSDLLMYVGHDDLIVACEQILKTHSNDIVKFIYTEHEVVFSDPIPLDPEEVHEILLKDFD